MAHADEHLTDVRVRRLMLTPSEDQVVFAWDYPGATLITVRIVRSDQGFAATPHEGAGGGPQRLVYEGSAGSFRDRQVQAGHTYCYTVFAQGVNGQWIRWARRRVRTARPRLPLLRARLSSIRARLRG